MSTEGEELDEEKHIAGQKAGYQRTTEEWDNHAILKMVLLLCSGEVYILSAPEIVQKSDEAMKDEVPVISSITSLPPALKSSLLGIPAILYAITIMSL